MPGFSLMNLSYSHLASTRSTNDEGGRWLKTAAPGHAFSVWAQHQTAGRGQRGNRWDQVPGEDLAWTLAIKWSAEESDRDPIAFNKAVTATIRDTVAHLIGTDECELAIKWPNDLLARRGGGPWEKCAGVLIENTWKGGRWDGVLVGLGLNVNAPRSAEVRRCSLIDVTGQSYELASIAQLLAERLLQNLADPGEESNYLPHVLGLGQVRAYTYRGVKGMGTVRGVDELGSLELEWQPDGEPMATTFVAQSNELEWDWLWA
jgi:BirA family biotin operon repressor/biotin-[acetyl-CoA-carboxylase] ligase